MTTENTVHEGPVCLHEIDDPMAFITTSSGTRAAPPTGQHAIEVASVWNGTVLEVRHLTEGSYALDDEHMPLDVADGFELFRWDDGEAVCRFDRRWRGTVLAPELTQTLEDLVEQGTALADEDEVKQFVLEPGYQVVVDVGPVTFVARLVVPGRKVAPAHDGVDAPFMGITSFAAFLAVAFGYVAASAPPAAAVTLNEIPDRFVELAVETPTPEPDLALPVKKTEVGEREGERVKRKEGKRGTDDAKLKNARGDVNEMQRNKAIAADAGVLGAMADAGLDDVFGTGALSDSITDSVGGLIGVKGNQFGSNGLGSRGGGLGNGGRAEGLHGGTGTRGRGNGDRDYGDADLGPRTEGSIGAVGGESITIGALDASLIDGVIRQNLPRFKYCYQRELTKDPTLGGKVTVKFTIIGDGTVSAAMTKSSSLNSDVVEGCLNKVMFSLGFPEPKGGGLVLVSYPFVFSPG